MLFKENKGLKIEKEFVKNIIDFLTDKGWVKDDLKIKYDKVKKIGTLLYVVIDDKYCGYIVISDKIKDDSYKLIKSLKDSNIKKIVMLTGDIESISKEISNELKLDEYYAELRYLL